MSIYEAASFYRYPLPRLLPFPTANLLVNLFPQEISLLDHLRRQSFRGC